MFDVVGRKLPTAVDVAGRTLPVIAERRAGARGIRLRADSIEGAVKISLPARGGVAEAVSLLERHQDWLARQVAGWPRPLPFSPGAVIPFDGDTLSIDWAASYPRTPCGSVACCAWVARSNHCRRGHCAG